MFQSLCGPCPEARGMTAFIFRFDNATAFFLLPKVHFFCFFSTKSLLLLKKNVSLLIKTYFGKLNI